MLKLFEEREKRIIGAKLQARKLDEGSAGALSKYESELQRARAAGNAERDKLRSEGVKTENELLAKVRGSTTEMLEAGRKTLAADIVAARAALKADASRLAKELAGRVLGRPMNEKVNE
jgi:F-type H+-transporting ATPase subunit b